MLQKEFHKLLAVLRLDVGSIGNIIAVVKL